MPRCGDRWLHPRCRWNLTAVSTPCLTGEDAPPRYLPQRFLRLDWRQTPCPRTFWHVTGSRSQAGGRRHSRTITPEALTLSIMYRRVGGRHPTTDDVGVTDEGYCLWSPSRWRPGDLTRCRRRWRAGLAEPHVSRVRMLVSSDEFKVLARDRGCRQLAKYRIGRCEHRVRLRDPRCPPGLRIELARQCSRQRCRSGLFEAATATGILRHSLHRGRPSRIGCRVFRAARALRSPAACGETAARARQARPPRNWLPQLCSNTLRRSLLRCRRQRLVPSRYPRHDFFGAVGSWMNIHP